MSLASSVISGRRWLGWKRAASICRSGRGIPFSRAIEAGTISVDPGNISGLLGVWPERPRRHASIRMQTMRSVQSAHTAQKAVLSPCPANYAAVVQWPSAAPLAFGDVWTLFTGNPDDEALPKDKRSPDHWVQRQLRI